MQFGSIWQFALCLVVAEQIPLGSARKRVQRRSVLGLAILCPAVQEQYLS